MSYLHEKIINYISANNEALYLPERAPSTEQEKMLVIVPNLSLNGAMTVLMELLSILMKHEIFIYVLSPEDGEFRRRLTEAGAVVFIRPYVKCRNDYRRFLQEAFDYVFINTAVCFYYVYYFINQPVRVIWWIHETKKQLDVLRVEFPNLGLLSENFTLLGVTDLVVEDIRAQFNIEIENMPMPIADCYQQNKGTVGDKVIFFMPAAYTYIKGQDILLQAIAMLPLESARKARFVFCGYRLEDQKAYYETIKKIAEKIPEVTFLEELPRDEVYEWYRQCDCVIAPSRVDATPTTIVEAMMQHKLCIVSDAAGISAYMQDCVNGFIFPSENVEELYKRLLFVIEARNELDKISEAGREIYETCFSIESVSARLNKLIGS